MINEILIEHKNTTYHPISEKEMHEWYFNLDFAKIADGSTEQVEVIAKRHGLDKEHTLKFTKALVASINGNQTSDFDAGHGFYIAVIQGFLRGYHYCNSRSFSVLMEEKPYLKEYTKSWSDVFGLPKTKPAEEAEEYTHAAETYISSEGVSKLLLGIEEDANLKKDLKDFYKDYLPVFINALNAAKDGNSGLLEARNVAEINAEDLNASVWNSSYQNCDVEGIRVYQVISRRERKKE